MHRRAFAQRTFFFCAAAPLLPRIAWGASSPNRKLVGAVMGVNGRGLGHIAALLQQPNVEIAYVCDVDARAVKKGIDAAARRQARAPRGEVDIRRVLEDRAVDFIAIAAPNHWHAPATILACSAGKHVYVEKPGSHNPWEAEMMVRAARTHRRQVQLGTQRRSWPWIQEIMAELHGGRIGKLTFARAWYHNRRGSIGRGTPGAPPDWLNYPLWQGPAPERPYQSNLVHYQWHWFWHWGNGELGNNGIHGLDLARWGLQAGAPEQVRCGGGRHYFEDDQETPDTCLATFEWKGRTVVWEGHSCHPRGFEGTGFGVAFQGTGGEMVIAGTRAVQYDLDQKTVKEWQGAGEDQGHFANFLGAIRDECRLNADIEEGQRATLLCHLGNIAYRTGETLRLDPATGRLRSGGKAARLWKRDYRPGWTPRV